MQICLCYAGDGDLRLVGRVDINGFATGALQVFIEGAFGAVCNTAFGPVDAGVACRQMGFAGGTALPLVLDVGESVDYIRPEIEVLLLFHPTGLHSRTSVQMHLFASGSLQT